MKHRHQFSRLEPSPTDCIRLNQEPRNGDTGEQRKTTRRRRPETGLNAKDRTLLALLASCRYLTMAQIQTVLGGPRDLRTLENRLRALAGDTGNVKLPDVGTVVLRRLRFRGFDGAPLVLWTPTPTGYLVARRELQREVKVPRVDVGAAFAEHAVALTDLFVALAAPYVAGAASRPGPPLPLGRHRGHASALARVRRGRTTARPGDPPRRRAGGAVGAPPALRRVRDGHPHAGAREPRQAPGDGTKGGALRDLPRGPGRRPEPDDALRPEVPGRVGCGGACSWSPRKAGGRRPRPRSPAWRPAQPLVSRSASARWRRPWPYLQGLLPPPEAGHLQTRPLPPDAPLFGADEHRTVNAFVVESTTALAQANAALRRHGTPEVPDPPSTARMLALLKRALRAPQSGLGHR